VSCAPSLLDYCAFANLVLKPGQNRNAADLSDLMQRRLTRLVGFTFALGSGKYSVTTCSRADLRDTGRMLPYAACAVNQVADFWRLRPSPKGFASPMTNATRLQLIEIEAARGSSKILFSFERAGPAVRGCDSACGRGSRFADRGCTCNAPSRRSRPCGVAMKGPWIAAVVAAGVAAGGGPQRRANTRGHQRGLRGGDAHRAPFAAQRGGARLLLAADSARRSERSFRQHNAEFSTLLGLERLEVTSAVLSRLTMRACRHLLKEKGRSPW